MIILLFSVFITTERYNFPIFLYKIMRLLRLLNLESGFSMKLGSSGLFFKTTDATTPINQNAFGSTSEQ